MKQCPKSAKELGISDNPWNLQIPCRHGHICPWGGADLAACTNRRGKLPDRLKEAGAWIAQDGDDGVNAVFPVSRFLEIAKIVKPRRRKQISEKSTNGWPRLDEKDGFIQKLTAINERLCAVDELGGVETVFRSSSLRPGLPESEIQQILLTDLSSRKFPRGSKTTVTPERV